MASAILFPSVEAIVDAIEIGIAILDRRGSVIVSNAAFTALGIDEAKIIETLSLRNATINLQDGRSAFVTLREVEDVFVVTARARNQPEFDESGTSIEQQFRARATSPREFILCLFELDRLAALRQTMGLSLERDILQAATGRLATLADESCPPMVIDGRLVLLKVQGQDQAFITRARDLLSRTYLIRGQQLNLRASIGSAQAETDLPFDEVFRRATLALSVAVEQGPGSSRPYEPGMDQSLSESRALEIDLRRALALRQFELVYQPQLEVASGRITGVEALLRWRHPTRGMVSPTTFIPLAESTGLIVPIGDWVIRRACEQASGWDHHLKVAVNVSAIQFEGSGLYSTVVAALRETGLEGKRLEIEITESLFLADSDKALDVLRDLKGLGATIAMDDFGTGYSALAYLRAFPFDKIKIDQSFIRGPEQASNWAIVSAISALGRNLGMLSVAEGVETAEQLARVEQAGCTFVQGYYVSRPLAAEHIDHFVVDWGKRPPREMAS